MPRNYYLDDLLNRDWLKAVALIRAKLGIKAGKFVTIEGRPVFIGGPGQGTGGAGQYSMFTGAEMDVMLKPLEEMTLQQRFDNATRFDDDIVAEEWANEEWTEWQEDLYFEQQEAIEIYSGDGYTEINQMMRDGEAPDVFLENKAYEHFVQNGDVSMDDWDEWRNEYIDEYADLVTTNLTEAIDKSKSPTDVVVFRGTDAALFEGLEVGDEWGDNGYVSTSLSESQADGFGDFKLQILVGKGSTAAFLNGLSEHEDELEVLLPSGSKFNIVSRTDYGAVLELQ